MTTRDIPRATPGKLYAQYAGSRSPGWSRRVSTENAASVNAKIDAAVRRGDTVEYEHAGLLRIDGAAVYDPSEPPEFRGLPSPAWFVVA
jgi:hypothetical protein